MAERTDKSKPAFPIMLFPEGPFIGGVNYEGMTLREYYAGLAMQGLLSHPKMVLRQVAADAVEQADALIKALEDGE